MAMVAFPASRRRLAALATALLMQGMQPALACPPDIEARFQPPAGWAWATLVTDDGAHLRYGRAGGGAGAQATVVLLTGYREFGEKYFETARDFLDRGFAVWQLDWRGQGGSDRYYRDREKIGATDFARDAEDLHRFIEDTVRPVASTPLVVVAHSLGAHIALRYMARHPGGVAAAVLSAPMLTVRTGVVPEPAARQLSWLMTKAGFGQLYLPGHGAWQRQAAGDIAGVATSDPRRGALQFLWPQRCPDLRMGGATFSWLHAALSSTALLRRDAVLRHIETPILIGSAGNDAFVDPDAHRRAAAILPRAEVVTFAQSRHELFMEGDPIRALWMDSLFSFLARTVR